MIIPCIFIQQYFELRTAMVASEEKKGTNTYPHKFEVSSSIPQYLKTYENLKPNEQMNSLNVSIAGRVMAFRKASKNLRFYDLQADGKQVQVVANLNDFKGKGDNKQDLFVEQHANIRVGDIIGATGYPGKTKAGELSVFAVNTILLSPCLRMLPVEKHGKGGITHQDTRYRQRYLDLILRDKVCYHPCTRSENVFLFLMT